MPARPNPSDDETVSVGVRDDRLCDKYEFLLLARQPVRVADFLRGEGLDPDAASPDLLRELDRLDAYYRPQDQTRPYGVAPVEPDEPDEAAAGMVLGGRYTLVQKIGGGGMGDVWMAQQTAPVRRTVAVKLIKAGMDTRAVLARFDAERQALAVMDHPHIARVLDGGSTPAGRPFFVMELVKGVPITKFCDERKFTPQQRLELFIPVCEAIQHAHQKGVIHRDIKPGNVLVAMYDDKPVVKVIDFGIAKATAQPLTERTLVTGFGAVVGTPEYMSPEQAGFNQLDIDTRSDVYSLGVLLYELLTGTTPVDRKSLQDAAVHEVLRIVREVDAPRPSDRLSSSANLPGIAATRGTEPKKLSGQFRGELDWVVLKALEKDRGRRYDSALAFAADVRRHLANEVVAARPPTPGYRLRKFVRRNRVPVLAVAAVFVALLGGVVGTTLGLLEANHQRDEKEDARGKEATQKGFAEANAATANANAAEAERKRVEADAATKAAKAAKDVAAAEAKKAREAEDATLADFRATTGDVLTNLLAKDSELNSEARTFLKELLKRWEGFSQRAGDDLRSRLIRAEGLFRVASIQSQLGSQDLALVKCHDAQKILDAVLVEMPDSVEAMELLAYVLGHIAEKWTTQSREEELRAYQMELQLWQEVARRKPADPNGRYMIARAHLCFGKYHLESRDIPLAEEAFLKCKEIDEALLRADGKNALYLDSSIACGLALAQCKDFSGKNPVAAYRGVLTQADAALADDPDRMSLRLAKSTIHENLGKALFDRGSGEEALRHYAQAHEVYQGLCRDSPGRVEFQRGINATRNRVAHVLASLKRFDGAKEQFIAATDGLSKLLEKYPRNDLLLREAAWGRGNYAVMLEGAGEPKAAIEQYKHTVRLGGRLLSVDSRVPSDHTNQIDTMLRLAELLDRQGSRSEWQRQLEEARDYLFEPIRLFPEYVSFADNYITVCNALLPVYERDQNREQVEKCYRTLYHLCDEYSRRQPKVVSWKTDAATVARNYGAFLHDIGHNDHSLTWINRSINLLVELRKGPVQDQQIAAKLRMGYIDRAIVQQRRERYDDSLKDWAAATALSDKAEHPFMRASSVLALAGSGRVGDAVAEIRKLQSLANWPGHIWYEFGVVCAKASAAEGREREKQDLVQASVAHFKKALRAEVDNGKLRRPAADFAALKDNEDFRKLAIQWAEKYPLEVLPPPRLDK